MDKSKFNISGSCHSFYERRIIPLRRVLSNASKSQWASPAFLLGHRLDGKYVRLINNSDASTSRIPRLGKSNAADDGITIGLLLPIK